VGSRIFEFGEVGSTKTGSKKQGHSTLLESEFAKKAGQQKCTGKSHWWVHLNLKSMANTLQTLN